MAVAGVLRGGDPAQESVRVAARGLGSADEHATGALEDRVVALTLDDEAGLLHLHGSDDAAMTRDEGVIGDVDAVVIRRGRGAGDEGHARRDGTKTSHCERGTSTFHTRDLGALTPWNYWSDRSALVRPGGQPSHQDQGPPADVISRPGTRLDLGVRREILRVAAERDLAGSKDIRAPRRASAIRVFCSTTMMVTPEAAIWRIAAKIC